MQASSAIPGDAADGPRNLAFGHASNWARAVAVLVPRFFAGGSRPRWLSLRANECRTLRRAASRSLTCTRGTVWVTQLGRHRDIILRAGQSIRTGRRGSVVVTAIEPAAMEVGS